VRNWKKPILVGRHAYGDVYKNVEYLVNGPGKAELVFTNENGEEVRHTLQKFKGPGIIQGIHNLDESIRSFAEACFAYALDQKVDLWFAAKDTISKTYDNHFKEIFEEIYRAKYQELFEKTGITYFYTLIDDAVARILSSEGGMLWALKNYDGDVMSDMLGAAFGSLAMMTSVLVSPHGYFEYESAHGTVQKHYYRYLKGEKTSTNPMAIIFAWSGALRKRGELDNIPELEVFADKLEAAAVKTIEDGIMTGDLAKLAEPPARKIATTEEFIEEVRRRLEKSSV
jgi:isocitrate dehydrogenase